ncbi:hypothetical protein, partial [Leptospira adleri]|uniref:hypothetical protein n=1 Tax=Leptospira adleri TaxID=2023186 RepID=UPI0010561A64
MHHVFGIFYFYYEELDGAMLIEAKSAFRAANSPQCYSKHENGNLLTGQHEVKGGWGGGVNLNISGAKA